jgi:predicted site-specific integrase-resolvase
MHGSCLTRCEQAVRRIASGADLRDDLARRIAMVEGVSTVEEVQLTVEVAYGLIRVNQREAHA